MKKKLKLEDLKVSSFITDLDKGTIDTIVGGESNGVSNCTRPLTFGLCTGQTARECPSETCQTINTEPLDTFEQCTIEFPPLP